MPAVLKMQAAKMNIGTASSGVESREFTVRCAMTASGKSYQKITAPAASPSEAAIGRPRHISARNSSVAMRLIMARLHPSR